MTVALATVGGLKLNSHIDYQKKVKYFSKYTEHVSLNSPEQYKKEKFYLPNWTDDSLWKKFHYNKSLDNDGRAGAIFKNKYPTPESFRDYCYGKAKEDESFSQCSYHTGNDWCESCLRNPTWDKN